MRYEDMHHCCQVELDEYRAKVIQQAIAMLHEAMAGNIGILPQVIQLLQEDP